MFTNCFLPSDLYLNFDELWLGLKESESWRGKTLPHEGFSKEDKEALNLFVFAIMLPIFEKETGIKCDTIRFPIFFLKRLFTKYYLWDAKPRNKTYLKTHIKNFDEKTEEYVKETLSTDVNSKFTSWLLQESSKLDSLTELCFNISKAIATLIEFQEIEKEMRPDMREQTYENVQKELKYYITEFPFLADLTNKDSKFMELLKNISWARYTFRWQRYYCPIRCSILTHMMESAILGYFMFVERHFTQLKVSTPKNNPKLFNDLENTFWVMLFHDVAEIWTDDIPSTAKDGMGIRETTEQQELEALNAYFYPNLPDYVQDYFKNGIMLEDVKDKELKAFYKSADYFSADIEVWWNAKFGANYKKFKEIIINSNKSKNRTPIAKKALRKYKAHLRFRKFLK